MTRSAAPFARRTARSPTKGSTTGKPSARTRKCESPAAARFASAPSCLPNTFVPAVMSRMRAKSLCWMIDLTMSLTMYSERTVSPAGLRTSMFPDGKAGARSKFCLWAERARRSRRVRLREGLVDEKALRTRKPGQSGRRAR